MRARRLRRVSLAVVSMVAIALSCVVPESWAEESPQPTSTPTAMPTPSPTGPSASVTGDPEPETSPSPVAEESLTPSPEPSPSEDAATPSPSDRPSRSEIPSAIATEGPEAQALPFAVPPPCTVSLVSAGTKPSGQASYLWGWAKGCTEPVQVEEKTQDGWVSLGTVTPDTDGYFTQLVPHPQRPGRDTYRATAGESKSPEAHLERLPSLTASTAGTKPVNAVTYLWGVFQTGGKPVEVQVLAGPDWRTVGSTTAAADGYYSVPLTYGQSYVGEYQFRAVARSAYDTEVVAPVALRRTAQISVSSAGTKPLMQTTYAWGFVHGQGGTPTWTEVQVQGAWAKSQQVTSGSDGSFTIPLTYGANVSGSYRYRIGTLTRFGTVYSAPFTLVRTAAFASAVSNTSAADVAKTYRAGCPVGASQLSTVRMTYRDYAGVTRWGEIIVRRDVAYQVRDAFSEAYNGGFRVAQLRNPNAWGGDDVAMMAANNTSAFNCRSVTGNPYRMSPHSYGRAVDVNPVQNPYRVGGKWYPSATYSTSRPRGVVGMHYPDGPFVKAMTRRGFEWFSGWDWHHFEK